MNNPPVSAADKRPGWFPKSKDIKRIERQYQLQQQTVHGRKRHASESMVDSCSYTTQTSTRRRRTLSEGPETGTDKSTTSHKRKRTIAKTEPELPLSTTPDQELSTGDRCPKVTDGAGTVRCKERRQSSSDLELEHKRARREKINEGEETYGGRQKGQEAQEGEMDVKKGCETVDMPEGGEINVEKTDEVERMEAVSLTEGRKTLKQSKKVKISTELPEEMMMSEADESGDKNRRKKRKKKHTKSKAHDVPELRVISKHEWMELRTEYLTLQKANMTQLKESLKAWKQTSSRPQPVDDGARDATKPATLDFVADVIVHVTSEQALTRKQLRADLTKFANVAYVDVKDGATEAFVRCVDAASATAIVNGQLHGCTLKLLTGDAERDYWNKAIADRQNKLTSKSKHPKQRGRDKVLKQVEKIEAVQRKHIKFDD
jgi:La-related protein 7